MVDRNVSRIGATCATGGSLLVSIGTAVHPMALTSDAIAAFTDALPTDDG